MGDTLLGGCAGLPQSHSALHSHEHPSSMRARLSEGESPSHSTSSCISHSTPSPRSGSFTGRPSSAMASPSPSPASHTGSHEDCLATVAEDEVLIAKEPKPATIQPATATPPIIEVKCGPLHAKMHVELFVCPGIHQQCIELDGEMISPKEFTVRANKDKQKDWKGSIRIGKSNLRSLMEMRSFDFYNHTLFCSAKCQSRNYITPKGSLSDKSDTDKDSRRSSKSSIEQLFAMQMAASSPPKHSNQLSMGYGSLGNENDSISQFVHLSQAMNHHHNNNNNNNSININNNSLKEEQVDVDDSLLSSQYSTVEHIQDLISSQPLPLWKQLSTAGVLEDILDILQTELNLIRSAAQQPHQFVKIKTCETFSRLALSFGLAEEIGQRLRARQLQNNIHVFLVQQRETAELAERKRRLDELTSSNAALSHLENIKRPCLSYSHLMQFQPNTLPVKLDPTRSTASTTGPLEFSSANSAFCFPGVAAAAQQMELLLKLAALSNSSINITNTGSPLTAGVLPGKAAPALVPPLPAGLPAPTPTNVDTHQFSFQLTDAILKIQNQQQQI